MAWLALAGFGRAQDINSSVAPNIGGSDNFVDIKNTSGGNWYFYSDPTPAVARMSRLDQSGISEYAWPTDTANFTTDAAQSRNRLYPNEFLRVYPKTLGVGSTIQIEFARGPSATHYHFKVLVTSGSQVTSLNIIDPNPTSAASVRWRVTFDQAVSGVTAANFAFNNSANISGLSITSVTADATQPSTSWTVTAATGTGNGILGLNWTGHQAESPTVPNSFTGQSYDFTVLPTFSQDPVGAGINRNSTFMMTAVATRRDAGPLTYQWYSGTSVNPGAATLISGATGSSYTPPNFANLGSFQYFCRATTTPGTTRDSATATIIVVDPPAITTQPVNVVNATGQTATFTVGATGTSLSYQWYQGAAQSTANPVGTNSASYTTPTLNANTSYWVRITNPGPTIANSNTATATVVTSVTAATGTDNAPVNTAFTSPFAVTVRDSANNLVAGIPITFTAPGSGASGFFPGNTVAVTVNSNASGVATAPTYTANGTIGTYNIVASFSTLSASFSASNFEMPRLVVSLATDVVDPLDNQTSLREAVQYANSLSGPQTITFAPALVGQTLTLSSPWSNANNNEAGSALYIKGNVSIQGPGGNAGVTLQIHPAAQIRHFLVDAAASLTVSNLTFTGGKAQIGGFAYGGSVWSFGSFTVRACTFTGNFTSGEGGAIQSWGGSPLLSVENSTFSGNTSTGIASVIDSGALQTTFRHLTITGNTSSNGTLWLYQTVAIMQNSILAGNSGDGVQTVGTGAFSAQSTNNILGSGGSGGLANGVNGNFIGVPTNRLYLGNLASNGGPTQTFSLLPGSPAINSGAVIAGITTDQRGLARLVGSAPDIGAVEDAVGNDDADGDTLTNAQELSLGTNPLAIDSDGDGYNDATELLAGSDPNLATSVPPATHIERVLGFGPARGLDLTGNFRYAFNVGTPGAAGQAGDANFTADNVAGVTVSATNNVANFTSPNFGSAAADHVLETVYQSIRWSSSTDGTPALRTVKVDLANIVPGRQYKLQLLFGENGAAQRTFDVFVDGALIVDNFKPTEAQGATFLSIAGSAVVYPFTATATVLNIVLDGTSVPAVAGLNPDPYLNGLTLEEIPTAATAPLLSPASGTYESSVNVTLNTTATGAVIRYTTDGSVPTSASGAIYSGPFTLTNSATVRAMSTGGGWLDSPVTSATYTVLTSLQAWRTLHGLPADGSQDLGNPSGDGVANLLKFAFNMAPNLGDLTIPNVGGLPENGAAGLPFISRDAQGHLVIEFIRRKATTNPGISYTVETGADLTNFTPLDLSAASVVSIDANWERVIVIDPTVTSQRFGRVHILVFSTYLNDFNVGLGVASLRGSAVWTNSAVKLTDEVNGGAGAVVFDGMTASPALNGFTARFNLALGPISSGVPADGASFAVGDLGTGVWGEAGPGTAQSLAVGFDTYNNGGDGSIGIHLWVNGSHIAFNATNPYTNGASVPVEISYDTAVGVTVRFNGATIFNNVATPGFAFPQNGSFGVGARTGGFSERAVVDDVTIIPR